MTTMDKIGVLADAAKYDASCSTSGSSRPNSSGGTGNAALGGICHSWSADGRCVALLKVLLTNHCAYDCAYCVNRRSKDGPRAAFEPDELVGLIMDFYRRNYIEGAFLSSGVSGCPDSTMERLIRVAKTLRTREGFNGYIHLKIIPGAREELVLEAARWADRVSVNIELPSAASLARIAPDKAPAAIFGPMRTLARASGFEPGLGDRALAAAPGEVQAALPGQGLPAPREGAPGSGTRDLTIAGGSGSPAMRNRAPEPLPDVMRARKSRRRNPGAALIPAGQTTQLVVGASPESDALILTLAENLYLAYDVRRVYYSAFVPTGADPRLPVAAPVPLVREHRLYQADWLFRFYGFKASEILDSAKPFLDPGIDPKSDWALRNLHFFPVEIHTADYRTLLRVPGIGPRSATRILAARKQAVLRFESLAPLGVVIRRARWFIMVGGRLPDSSVADSPERLRLLLSDPKLKATPPNGQGELPWN